METAPSAKVLDAQPAVGCPLTAALNAIGGKWNMICLYWLDRGTRRTSLSATLPFFKDDQICASI